MRKLNPFKPTDIGGCQLWLDGADPAGTGTPPSNGATVSTWVDKATAKNATATGTPTYLTGGGINFNGSSYFLNQTFSQNLSQRSIFIVFQETTNTQYAGVLTIIPTPNSGNDQSTTNGLSSEITNNTLCFVGISYFSSLGSGNPLSKAIYYDSMNGTTGSGYFNGTNAANVTAGYTAGTCSGYGLGGRWQAGSMSALYRLNGVIYEILFFSTSLSTPNRQQVEGYLAQKWGLQANLPAGSPGRTGVIYPHNLLIDSLTTGQPTRKPFIRALRPVALGGSFRFTTTPSQYLSIPNSTAFTQNTAFTYELWYYPTSTNTGYLVAMLQPNWITVRWNTGTAGTIGLDMSYVGNPPGYVPQNRIYAINRWHHIALTWNGTNGVLYMNGVSEAVFTGAGGLVNAGNPLLIGQYQGQGQPTPLGYFTNIRYVKGVSVYTGAFTPPTAPLSVTQSAGTNISAITAGQTQLLISATTSGSLLTDTSTNNFTITNNGSVAWNALTPFS